MRNTKAYHLAVWGTVDKKQSPGKATWQVACKRCPWQGIVPSVTRIAQHISGSKSDVKACPSPDPELLKLVRDHEAAASPAGASSSRRRSGDDMEPSPSRLRATRNPSQEVVTKETIDDALTDLMTREWGVPLHILRGDGLARFCRLVGLYPGIYTPPSSEHMRTVLVRKAALRLDTELAPLRAERAVFGCGISFDGYTDESTRSMLNATVTTPSGSMLTQLYFNSRLLKRAGKGVASIAEEWQAEQGEGEREEEEGEGEEELLQRLQAVNDDALDIAVEADMAKVAARVAAQEAEALALALSL